VLWFTKLMRPLVKNILLYSGRIGVPVASMNRRFSARAYQRSSPCYWARLSAGWHSTEFDLSEARAHSASRQGLLGWDSDLGASQSPDQHATDEGVCDRPKGSVDVEDGKRSIIVRSAEPEIGLDGKFTSFLWSCSLARAGAANVQVLHKENLLGHEPSRVCAGRREGTVRASLEVRAERSEVLHPVDP
jgi:hypothetical protein